MKIEVQDRPSAPRRPDAFADTRWSLVAAMRGDSIADAHRSLVDLCQSYWYPVFAYVRRSGHAPESAYALTQAFFGHLLAELRVANPHAFGRFRGFLLARLDAFLTRQGGDGMPASDHAAIAAPQPLAELERRQQREHAPEATPERAFQRGFALELLAHSMSRLRREADQGGRLAMFEQLEPYLTRDPDPGQYDLLSRALGTRALAVVVAIKRLRQRFRELVDEEVSETVTSGADLDAERGALLAILGGAR